MMKLTNLLCLGMILGCFSVTGIGCVPRVKVTKNPGTRDCGFRYYRPKPYLLISPAGDEMTRQEGKEKPTTTKIRSDEFVSIDLQYLPDFSEEYAIDVRNGLGSSKVSLTLEDGWKLTSVNQDLDAQFDENVKAISDLVKAGGSLIPTGPSIREGDVDDPPGTKYRWVVKATNVPLGYYESVIGCTNGKKQLYGWRYVGFAPFNSCPTLMCGGVTADCNDDSEGPIYGLAFQEGVMVFRQLDELQALPATDPQHFNKTTVQHAEVDKPKTSASKRSSTPKELESALRQLTGDNGLTLIARGDGGFAIQLTRSATPDVEQKVYDLIRERTGVRDDQVDVILPNQASGFESSNWLSPWQSSIANGHPLAEN